MCRIHDKDDEIMNFEEWCIKNKPSVLEEYYPEYVDIGYKILDARNMYYYVGKVGPGMTKAFPNAVNVRRVTA